MCEQRADIKRIRKDGKKADKEHTDIISAKEYLQQLYRMDVVIRQKILEKEDLRKIFKNTVCPEIFQKRNYAYRIYSCSGYEEKVRRLITLEEEIDNMLEKFMNQKHIIICQIHDLNNVNQIKVLYRRYARFEKYEQIAAALNFSDRNIYAIHEHGLREFQKKHMIK